MSTSLRTVLLFVGLVGWCGSVAALWDELGLPRPTRDQIPDRSERSGSSRSHRPSVPREPTEEEKRKREEENRRRLEEIAALQAQWMRVSVVTPVYAPVIVPAQRGNLGSRPTGAVSLTAP